MSKIYIAGAEVGRSIQKEDLEEKFSRFGRINSVWVARQPPGFAFIEYEDPRDAEDSVRDMNNTEILGCEIKVEISKGRGGGGGGGGGYGGGYGDRRSPPRGDMGGPEIKPGDWKCDGCGVNNFARRFECFRCGASKDGGGRGYDDRRGGYDDRRGGYYDDRRGGYDDRRGGYDDRDRRRDSRDRYDDRDRRRDSRDRSPDRRRGGSRD